MGHVLVEPAGRAGRKLGSLDKLEDRRAKAPETLAHTGSSLADAAIECQHQSSRSTGEDANFPDSRQWPIPLQRWRHHQVDVQDPSGEHNGRYPAKLEDLAPAYLAAVPGDLFSGKPLVYKPAEKGYLFYSFGVNGKKNIAPALPSPNESFLSF